MPALTQIGTSGIKDNAITTVKIVDGTIVAADLADGAVTTAKLANNAVTDDKSTITVSPAAISDQANTSTGYFDIPSGTTAQRPSSPNSGYIRLNTTIGSLEFWNNGSWSQTNYVPTINSITGTILSGVAGASKLGQAV